MRQIAQCVLATLGMALIASCGGGDGSNDPADVYTGAWKSACFAYRGNDGFIYFQTRTVTLRKNSPTSLKGKNSDTVAFADSACTTVLGPISDYPDITIELGPKGTVFEEEADTITLTDPTGTFPGYMKSTGSQLFVVTTSSANVRPVRWGLSSPHTRLQPKQAALSTPAERVPADRPFSPRSPQSGYQP
jgi:hypothetical protein